MPPVAVRIEKVFDADRPPRMPRAGVGGEDQEPVFAREKIHPWRAALGGARTGRLTYTQCRTFVKLHEPGPSRVKLYLKPPLLQFNHKLFVDVRSASMIVSADAIVSQR